MKWTIELEVVIRSLQATSPACAVMFAGAEDQWIRKSIAQNYWSNAFSPRPGGTDGASLRAARGRMVRPRGKRVRLELASGEPILVSNRV